jgi:acetamidase/formamidase
LGLKKRPVISFRSSWFLVLSSFSARMLRPRTAVEAISLRLLPTPGVLGTAVDPAVEAISLRLLPIPEVLGTAVEAISLRLLPIPEVLGTAVEAISLRLLPTPGVLGTAVAIAVVIQAV